MSQSEEAYLNEQAAESGKKSGFALPSAYTILFALIVLAAIATWIIPAGVRPARPAGPRDVSRGRAEAVADPRRLAHGADQRHVRHRGRGRKHQLLQLGSLFGAIDVALFILVIGGFLGVTMKTGAIQAGIGRLVERLEGGSAS